MNQTVKELKDRIIKLNFSFHYHPSTCTRIQGDITKSKEALEELVTDGYLEKVFVPKYHYEFFEEVAAPTIEGCDISELQDPDDYMPLEKHDLEFVEAYRRVSSKKETL